MPIEPTLAAHVVGDTDHAILVLTGQVQPGCDAMLRAALLESEKRDHGHVIVDLRHVTGMSREAVKTLLWELGRAFDEHRTLRLVVRDAYQKRYLDGLGLAGMLPTHATLDEAIAAAEDAERRGLAASRGRKRIDFTAHDGRADTTTTRSPSNGSASKAAASNGSAGQPVPGPAGRHRRQSDSA